MPILGSDVGAGEDGEDEKGTAAWGGGSLTNREEEDVGEVDEGTEREGNNLESRESLGN